MTRPTQIDARISGRPGRDRGLGLLVLIIWLGGGVAWATEPQLRDTSTALDVEPLLATWVAEALASRPELAQRRALLQASHERAAQAHALPDPVLSLGLQNDGFRSLQIGKMATSYVTVMASQTLPWYGKRDQRRDLVSVEARLAEADLTRAQLSIQADVERGYIELLLVRDQLALLSQLDSLWAQATALAQVRYEAGDGAQSELLRAQLEQSRLKQRRLALTAEEQRRVTLVNRLRGQPLGTPLPTQRSLSQLPEPTPTDLPALCTDAEARSPELQKALLAVEQSQNLVALAERDYYPDITVTAGVMPRGTQFEPMWQAGLSVPLPVWGASKQGRAVAENQRRSDAALATVTQVRELLQERVTERQLLFEALRQTQALYRAGLLVQSEATVKSTLAQYQVGRISFASVLEALTGYVGDLNVFYESLAALWRLQIAQREVSLEANPGAAPFSMGSGSVPGANAIGTSSRPADTGSASPGTPASSAAAMPTM